MTHGGAKVRGGGPGREYQPPKPAPTAEWLSGTKERVGMGGWLVDQGKRVFEAEGTKKPIISG